MKITKLMACGMALLFSFAISCEKNDGPDPTPTPESYFEKEGLTPHFGVDQFQDNVTYLGGLKPTDLPWVRARAGKKLTTDVNDAKILILGNSVIDENKTVLDAAYKEGKFIILCNPDVEKLKSLRKELGWVFIIPGKIPSNDFAICFAPRNTFLLTPPLQGDTTAVTSGSEKKTIDMNEVKYANTSVFTATRGLTQFIQRYKERLSSDTKTAVDAPNLSATINTLRFSRSVDYDYSVCVRGRYFAVFIGMAFDMKVYPCYIPEGVNNHGDYYNVEAVATNFAPTMYEYADPFNKGGNYYEPVGTYTFAHYWPYVSGDKEKSSWGDAYFIGPYNGDFNFLCYAKDATSLKFTERPTPASSISTTSYSDSKTKSWEVGLSGGISESDGLSAGINFGFGGSTTNSVHYSVSDVTISNNCSNNEVKYQMTYNNVPKDVDKNKNIDEYLDYSKMPVSCRSTTDLSMVWEWTTSTPKGDYDESIQRLDFELQSHIYIAARDKDLGWWYSYDEDFEREFVFHDDGDDSPMRLGRIPVGCLRIDNKCTQGQMLFNIYIKDENDSIVVKSGNTIAQGEYYEVLLPQKGHRYTAYLDLGKSVSDTKPYLSDTTALPLLINTNDKRVLSVGDYGGDFKTDQALIKVKNQSQIKLARNIKVYKSSDKSLVATYPNSVGYNECADIYVKANVKYYLTMEFGSSSSFDVYVSASEYTPKPYNSESDATVLTVTATGGDFIKM